MSNVKINILLWLSSLFLVNLVLIIYLYYFQPILTLKNYNVITLDTSAVPFFDLVLPRASDGGALREHEVETLELPDPIAGYRLKSFHPRVAIEQGPHDILGFRNLHFPNRVETLIVGDSFTYGFNVLLEDSWPVIFSQATGKTVYNASVGAWSMLQFTYIAERLRTHLKPKLIVLSPYWGNDLYETKRELARLPYWKWLRDEVDPSHEMTSEPIIRDSKKIQILEKKQTLYVNLEKIFKQVDLKRSVNIAALKAQLKVLSMFIENIKNDSVKLVVAPIPTKESLIFDMIEDEKLKHLGSLIRENEMKLSQAYKELVEAHGIQYIDSYDVLKNQILQNKKIYTEENDSHFNELGYWTYANYLKAEIERQ